MGKDQVKLEAQDLLLGVGDDAALDQFYPQVLEELARATGLFVQTTTFLGVAGQAVYELVPRALKPLAVHYFPNEIEYEPVEALDAWDPTWRSLTASAATHWTRETEDSRRIRFFPRPTAAGTSGFPPFLGIPGAPAPTNNVVVMFTEVPLESDLYEFFDGLLALRLAARESRRLGETRDTQLADVLDQLVALIEGALFGGRGDG